MVKSEEKNVVGSWDFPRKLYSCEAATRKVGWLQNGDQVSLAVLLRKVGRPRLPPATCPASEKLVVYFIMITSRILLKALILEYFPTYVHHNMYFLHS